jgi:hypothetical protein
MKSALLFICSLFAILQTKAQDDDYILRTRIGMSIGINNASIFKTQTTQDIKSSGKIGMFAGAFVEVPLATNFFLQPEIGFNQTGGVFKSKSFTQTISVNYLSVTGLAKYKFTRTGLFVFGGAQISLIINAVKTDSTRTQVKDQFAARDLSAVAGFEYLLNEDISIGARYQYGFLNVSKVMTTGEMKLSAYNFRISYRF